MKNQKCFTRFFQENIKDPETTWKRIKKIVSVNSLDQTIPIAIAEKIKTIINPSDIAEVAVDTQSPIQFFKKKYLDYLPPFYFESFFIFPTNNSKVFDINFPLNL